MKQQAHTARSSTVAILLKRRQVIRFFERKENISRIRRQYSGKGSDYGLGISVGLPFSVGKGWNTCSRSDWSDSVAALGRRVYSLIIFSLLYYIGIIVNFILRINLLKCI